MTLDELRNKIDEIDEELIKKLEERFDVVMQIGEYKKEKGLPIVDHDRELAKYDRIESLSTPLFAEFNRTVFAEIIEVSKEFQEDIVSETLEE